MEKKSYKLRKVTLTNKDIYILRNYLQGVSSIKIARSLGISRWCVLRSINKIERGIKKWKKFYYKHSYFLWRYIRYRHLKEFLKKEGKL